MAMEPRVPRRQDNMTAPGGPPPSVPAQPAFGMEEGAAPPEGEGASDFSKGFRLQFDVLPSGQFRVSRPMPLTSPSEVVRQYGDPEDQRAAEQREEDLFPTLTDATKALYRHVTENPLAPNEEAAFQSGFGPSEAEQLTERVTQGPADTY